MMSLDSDESLCSEQLYRGYKRLVYNISERLRKQEVLSLVYQYDLPSYYNEVGSSTEPGHALRVLGHMENMQIFSMPRLLELAGALETLGRADLGKTVREFEEQNRLGLQNYGCSDINDEEFLRQDTARRSFEAHRNRRPWPFYSVRGRSTPTTKTCETNLVLGGGPQPSTSGRNSSTDKSREGTPYECVADFDYPPALYPDTFGQDNPPNAAMLSVSVTQLTADSLLQQVNQLRHTLDKGGNQEVSQPLVQAYLAVKQVCSYLNIAYTTLQSEKAYTNLQSEKIKVYESGSSFMHIKSNSNVSDGDFRLFNLQHQQQPRKSLGSNSMIQSQSCQNLLHETERSTSTSPLPPPLPPKPNKPVEYMTTNSWYPSSYSEPSHTMIRSYSVDALEYDIYDPEETVESDSTEQTGYRNRSLPLAIIKPKISVDSEPRYSSASSYNSRLAKSQESLQNGYVHLTSKKPQREWFKPFRWNRRSRNDKTY